MMRALWILLSVVTGVMTGCGGGGSSGAGSGAGAGGSGSAEFSLSATSVSFEANRNGTTPAPQLITGTVTNAPLLVYVFAQHSGTVIDNVIITTNGSTSGTGTLQIFAKPPSSFSTGGTFNEVLTIRACLDLNCNTQVSGSPKTISVTYRVGDVTASPASLNFNSVEEGPAKTTTVKLTNTTGSAWTASVKYVAGVSDWLTVTPTSSGASSDTLTLTAGALSVGTYSATIQVTAGALITSIPVTYIVTPNLVIAENGPDFKAIVGQANLPAPANLVVASISGATVSYSTSVKYGTGASNWLTISGNTAPGTLTLAPSTMTMPVGKKFSATVTLTPAHGTAINVPVTYEVDTSSLDLPSEPLEYTIDASSTAIDSVLKRTITTSDSGVPVTWTAVPLSPWVTVTPSSGTSGTTVTVTIDPAQLATVENGLVPNSIVFTYDGPGFTGAITSKTVLLHLLLPTVDVVAPYVAYVSEQKPVVIRGSGFKQPGVTTIMFDTLAAQSVDIVSDTEMHVVPPLVSTAGRLIASVPNALGSPRPQAELVVREHPNYAYAALDTSVVGSSNYNIVYDAERDAVITARGVSLSPSNSSSSTVQRFSYDAGTHTWTRTAKSFTELYDVALSLDGKTLFALTTSKLYFLDPVTLDTTLDVALPRPPFGSFPQLAAMNDKNLLIASNGLNYTLRYNYLSGIPLGSGGIASSLDGSLAYFSASAGISTYKASTSSVSTPVLRQPLLAARVNRDGSRVLIDGTLYNGIFNFIGKNNSTAGFLLQADSLSPDGTRVYEYENGSTPAKIHVLDATTFTYPNPLNELSTIPLIDNPGSAHSIVSLDGKALFIIGDQKFIVQPVP